MAQNDILKRYLDAGLAFTALTQARAEALVTDLVRAGEVQADQAREAVTDLIERSRKNSEKLLDTVRTEVRAQLSERGVASQADLDRLEARLSALLGSAARSAKAAGERVGSRSSSPKRATTSAQKATATASGSAKKATTSAQKATKKATTSAKKATKNATTSAKKATKKSVNRATTTAAKATPARKTAAKKRA